MFVRVERRDVHGGGEKRCSWGRREEMFMGVEKRESEISGDIFLIIFTPTGIVEPLISAREAGSGATSEHLESRR